MLSKGIQIRSYELLGMDYVVKINNVRYTVSDLSDTQLNKLIEINLNDKTREFRNEMLFIFNDIKLIRRRQKLIKLKEKIR